MHLIGNRRGVTIRMIVLVVMLLWTLIPIYWLVTSALKTNNDLLSNFELWPHNITFSSFLYVKNHFQSYFINSLIVSISSVAGCLLVGIPAAYSLTRFRFKKIFKSSVWGLILTIQMIIPIVYIIPLYQIFKSMGLDNTLLGLTIAFTFVNLPFVTWMMSSYFAEAPEELDEAGLIDGASRWQIFVKIGLPLAGPAIASVAILAMIFTWNNLLFALYLTSSSDAGTVPVGIVQFITQYTTYYSEMAAAGTLSIIPVIIFVLFIQKYIVRGLTAGAIK